MPITAPPLVSVVIPVYNPDPVFLRQAVESVLGQTFLDFELVLVEDPSPSSACDILHEIADSRIRHFVNAQRTSLPEQHNKAVSLARGELVARFDADDICEPERLEKQVAFLSANPDIDIVASQLTIIDRDGRITAFRDYPLEHDAIIRAMWRYNPISGSNAMFRRSVVQDIGGWRENTDLPAQDFEWYSRAAAAGHRFAILPERLIRYRIHPSQIKNSKLKGTLRTTIEVKRRYWWSSMDAVSRLQLLAENVLLALPSSLVLRAFMLLRYRRW